MNLAKETNYDHFQWKLHSYIFQSTQLTFPMEITYSNGNYIQMFPAYNFPKYLFLLVRSQFFMAFHQLGHHSPKSVSTLRGSYGKGKSRCLIRVLTLGRGIFPVNFRIKWLL